jgi:phosphoadenosine phosphosulfate reductase
MATPVNAPRASIVDARASAIHVAGGIALSARVEELSQRYADSDAAGVVLAAIEREFAGHIALVSSFGASSAVLLHMAATIDKRLPVIFLNTGKLFGETRRYRDTLIQHLQLGDVRELRPDDAQLAAEDRSGDLWLRASERCCHLRKVLPLQKALVPFAAWMTGRRRTQGGARAALPAFEAVDGRIKINPLAAWTPADLDAYFARHDLPRHPLEAEGFRSIGCFTCTDRVGAGEDERAGRWRGQGRTECGIHVPRGLNVGFGEEE